MKDILLPGEMDMADSRILEVMIASDDHRMLSANAEAWWLVQNDVFVPFESFLTEDSKKCFPQPSERFGYFLVPGLFFPGAGDRLSDQS